MASNPGGSKWPEVTRTSPCPICKKPDRCKIAPDGVWVLCFRKAEGGVMTSGGSAGPWRHKVRDNAPPRKPRHPKSGKLKADLAALAAAYAANITPEHLQLLAERLNLPADALNCLDGVGLHRDEAGPHSIYPERDALGAIVGLSRRYKDGSKKSVAGSRRGLTLPRSWREKPGPVYIVEGQTDTIAMTAAGLCVVGRPSNSGGAELLAELLQDWPADRGIIVVGENDRKPDGLWPGKAGAESVAEKLAAALRRPVPVAFPPADAKDVRGWLTAGARGETPWPDRGVELARLLEESTTPAGAATPGRTVILIGTDEYRVNDEAAAALGADADLFHRAGSLVFVLEQTAAEGDTTTAVRRAEGGIVVRELSPPLLRERLTRCVKWERSAAEGETKPTHPPGWCVQAVHARGEWAAVRKLEAVLSHPALIGDGSLLAAEGYDPRTGLLVATPPGLSVAVPDSPTRADIAAAVAALNDVLSDFPFETPAHRAAWFAGLLTPLAWFAFDGPAPMFLIDANTRGAGKGLLADVIALIVTGRRFPVMSYTNDREELRKKITSLAAEGERLVLLDNLAGSVGNDTLDAALTSTRWKDRLLGGNRVYDGPLHVAWYATGNNVQLRADTSRRVCHVRLETPEERPELRAGLRYPELRVHVRGIRGRLLSAALSILRGWVVAGRPRHGLPSWGSYEGWSGLVREAVVFAGLPDPGETRLALQTAADRDAEAMTSILAGLEAMDPDGRGVTVAAVMETVKDAPAGGWREELRGAVEELCGKLCGRTLGYKFRHFKRRNFNGRMLDTASPENGSNRWAVLPVGPKYTPGGSAAGDGGDAGHVPARQILRGWEDQMLPD